MKKYIQLLPTILYPYFIIASIFLIFGGGNPVVDMIWEKLDNNGYILLGIILAVFILSMILNIITVIIALANKWDAKSLAKTNMIIKCIQIPAYLCLFALGFMCLITIFTAGISFVVFVLDCLGIFLTGLFSISGIVRAWREGKISWKGTIAWGICSFICCVDVIMAIVMYQKIKKR